MSKVFYPKLAITNIKKNAKTYIPYILTCIFTIVMFYNMHALSINAGLNKMQGGQSLKVVLNLGNIVIGIFSVIFIFYTNSFLIKKRKTEFGLYNVLGLEKRHIAKILFYENIITIIVSIILGLVFGILTNKLIFLLLLKIVGQKNPIGFFISKQSLIVTLILFLIIFFVIFLFNLIQIKLSKPIELIKGSNQGEREPKTKWILTIVGFISLAYGYFLAIKIQEPMKALQLFFIAVILVIIGTYCLFTAGSIAILKLLRKNKNFYYKTNNFISISGMMYRMKQNAVGLANICILSTMVLVMVSTTVSLYAGLDDVIKDRMKADIQITMHISGDEIKDNADVNFDKVEPIVKNNLDFSKVKDNLEYTYGYRVFDRDNDKFVPLKNRDNYNKGSYIEVISLNDYNKIGNKNETLNDDEVLIYSKQGNYSNSQVTIDSKTFKVKNKIEKIENQNADNIVFQDYYTIITKNINILGDNAMFIHTYSFNYAGSDQEIMSVAKKMQPDINKIGAHADTLPGVRSEIFSIYGGLFFLGIFLGILFLMATVLIIYYKQISEGIEDKKRFDIMQKVGMDKKDIRKTIKRQVLMMFFLPLITAIIHICFAFPMIQKLLLVLQLKNVNLFMIFTAVTALVFTAIYGVVFGLTARMYYKIVK